jgi:hypothetical protein
MPEDFSALVRPIIEQHLAPGEPLKGIAASVQQKMFSSQMIAIGVTDVRLVIQAVDRHTRAKGEPIILTHKTIESVDLLGAGDGWRTKPMALLNAKALTLKVRLRDGQQMKLMLMRGGAGLMGSMSGGASQEQGVLALAEWVRDGHTVR